jgi:hypothetical protein
MIDPAGRVGRRDDLDEPMLAASLATIADFLRPEQCPFPAVMFF